MRPIVAALAAVVATSVLAAPAPLPRHGLVVFSSQCVSEMSGDLYGMRVTLRRIGDIDDAIVERADYATEVTWPVAVDSLRGHLSFAVHPSPPASVAVQGRLTHGGRTLTLSGLPDAPADHQEVLTRVTDFSRSMPVCGRGR